MAAVLASSASSLHQDSIPISLSGTSFLYDTPEPSSTANVENPSGDSSPIGSSAGSSLPDETIQELSMRIQGERMDTSSAEAPTPGSVQTVESTPKSVRLRLEVDHDQSQPVVAPDVYILDEAPSQESLLEKAIYPPLVSPTQTYQPPVPTLSMMHASKSPTSINPSTSIFRRLSSQHYEPEPISDAISPVTDGSGKLNRSSSAASSGASSTYSANSATIHIPQPGTNAYTKNFKHRRQQSDPKYVRFMSAVSENQRQASPEQYIGYPGLVSHMTETQNLIFRRFDDVHVRLLLYLQDEISQLEAQLHTLDEQNTVERGMHNGTFREDIDRVRVDIMEKLRICVGEYDTMILAFSRMQESKASDKAVRKLKDWLRKYSSGSAGRHSPPNGGAIAREELEWVEKANDLTNLSISTATSSTVVKQSPLTRLFPSKRR
jgi:hypothetical protein